MEPKIPLTDVWPLIAITGDVAGAYRTLMKNGRIRMKDVYVSKKSNLAVIEYFSTENREQTLIELERMRKRGEPDEGKGSESGAGRVPG